MKSNQNLSDDEILEEILSNLRYQINLHHDFLDRFSDELYAIDTPPYREYHYRRDLSLSLTFLYQMFLKIKLAHEKTTVPWGKLIEFLETTGFEHLRGKAIYKRLHTFKKALILALKTKDPSAIRII